MRYKATFVGRDVGAIGIMQGFTTEVEGGYLEQARLRLYDRFDHIKHLRLTPIADSEVDTANSRTSA